MTGIESSESHVWFSVWECCHRSSVPSLMLWRGCVSVRDVSYDDSRGPWVIHRDVLAINETSTLLIRGGDSPLYRSATVTLEPLWFRFAILIEEGTKDARRVPIHRPKTDKTSCLLSDDSISGNDTSLGQKTILFRACIDDDSALIWYTIRVFNSNGVRSCFWSLLLVVPREGGRVRCDVCPSGHWLGCNEAGICIANSVLPVEFSWCDDVMRRNTHSTWLWWWFSCWSAECMIPSSDIWMWSVCEVRSVG